MLKAILPSYVAKCNAMSSKWTTLLMKNPCLHRGSGGSSKDQETRTNP